MALALCDEQQSRLPLLCLRLSSLIAHSSFVLISEQGEMLPGQKSPREGGPYLQQGLVQPSRGRDRGSTRDLAALSAITGKLDAFVALCC